MLRPARESPASALGEIGGLGVKTTTLPHRDSGNRNMVWYGDHRQWLVRAAYGTFSAAIPDQAVSLRTEFCSP